MKKFIVTFILCILFSSPSFGFQKNNGVICELPNAELLSKETPKFFGFFAHSIFVITEYYYIVNDNTNEVIQLSSQRYRIKEITDDFYRWDYYQLNRKTLELERYRLGKDIMTYNCKVYSNETKFKKDFDDIKSVYVNTIKQNENKI
jgi:hypothetical protein